MDFNLTVEQELLRDTAKDLLARSYDPERRDKVAQTDLGWDRQVWRTLAETGLLGLTIPESDGGMGAGPVEVMVVMTEIGRRLAPEPVLDAALLPASLIADAGSPDQRGSLLPRLADGTLRGAFAHEEPGVRWPSRDISTHATHAAGSWAVTGAKNPVRHGDCAEILIVSATLPDGGIGLFLVDPAAAGVTRTGYPTHDDRRAAQFDFAAATAEPLGAATDASAHVVAATARAQAALGAEALGAMEEALRLTTDYLKTRKQFGVTLSKFQTLTQRAADMYVSLELARSMCLYATMALADGSVDPVIASRAKLRIARSAKHIGQEAIQMHGGIGMTAEYPVGHYTARLTAINHTLGDAEAHLSALAESLTDHDMVEL
jgi:alkylation response protein AidB-like acyl-CoA dehydrogenase